MKHSNKIIILAAVFLLILGISSTIWQTAAQTKPLTYPEIITALNIKLPNASFKNKSQLIDFLIRQIKLRKVDKPLNNTYEDDLRQAGATNELIEAVRQNLPSLPGNTVTPKINDTTSKFRNSIGMAFVLIPAGTFQMGDRNNGPIHTVTVTQGFYMGRTEVTQAQWEKIMGTTVKQQRDKANPSFALHREGADYPMYYVSWDEVHEFIRKLNATDEGTYRLPTEAEWEYAARAGSTSKYSFGDDESLLGNYAWYSANSGNTTHEVGTKQPNGWGLYDMEGNVWEWCEDWYGEYPREKVTDPKGTASGSYRVNRGGSWNYLAVGLRSANRLNSIPSFRSSDLGFRLLRTQ